MRRQLFLASVGAMALAGTALAADLPIAPPPPPPVFTWTGIYVGGYGGGGGVNWTPDLGPLVKV
jgi:outer membrane immunogenic protein